MTKEIPTDAERPYPRLCAHRGYHVDSPENSLVAFVSAVEAGADEIEFDLWYTKDGEIVSTHDGRLERTSDGEGFVYDYTYEELLRFDFGIKTGEKYRGTRILAFEQILEALAGRVVMNIHVKTVDDFVEYDQTQLDKIISLIRRYKCEKYMYFMTGNDGLLKQMKRTAPDIKTCCGGGSDAWHIVDRALECGCDKVQMRHSKYTPEMIERAHANGIICNIFYSDVPEKTMKMFRDGIDVVLTNDYVGMKPVLEEFLASK